MTNTTLQLTDLLAHNAPSFAYRDATARWLEQIIHDDSQSHGRWCFFTLTGPYLPRLPERFTEQCNAASDVTFPHQWPSAQGSNARLRTFGCCVALVPSRSAAGTLHYHGLCRVPVIGVEDPLYWSRVTIFENQVETTIRAPHIVRRIFWRNNSSVFGNLHLGNDGTQLQFLETREERERVCSYLSKSEDGEVRGLDQMEWAPERVRAALKVRNNDRAGTPVV